MFPSSNIYTSLRKILFIFLNPIETETLLHLHANENGHSTTNEKPVRVEVVQAATDKVNAIFKYHTGEVRNISGDQNIGRGVCVYVCVRGGGGGGGAKTERGAVRAPRTLTLSGSDVNLTISKDSTPILFTPNSTACDLNEVEDYISGSPRFKSSVVPSAVLACDRSYDRA